MSPAHGKREVCPACAEEVQALREKTAKMEREAQAMYEIISGILVKCERLHRAWWKARNQVKAFEGRLKFVP